MFELELVIKLHCNYITKIFKDVTTYQSNLVSQSLHQ